jgi:hypothetical protein
MLSFLLPESGRRRAEAPAPVPSLDAGIVFVSGGVRK